MGKNFRNSVCVQYLGFGDSFMGAYIFQNLPNIDLKYLKFIILITFQ